MKYFHTYLYLPKIFSLLFFQPPGQIGSQRGDSGPGTGHLGSGGSRVLRGDGCPVLTPGNLPALLGGLGGGPGV